MFQDREQDQCGDAGGETSVIEHQTAVQGTGGGTHGSHMNPAAMPARLP